MLSKKLLDKDLLRNFIKEKKIKTLEDATDFKKAF